MPEGALQINPFHIEDPLRDVTAAVTPVVMISASAILISGINSKHQSLSDRVRGLAAEYRLAASTTVRKENIRKQIAFFRRRLRYVYTALVSATLPFFMAGVVLILVAVGFLIRELRMSSQTMLLELFDIEGDAG